MLKYKAHLNNGMSAKEYLVSKITIWFFILMLLSDFLMKYLKFGDLTFHFRFSGIIKLIFEFFLVFLVIRNNIDKFFKYLIICLLFCFFIGQFFLETGSIFKSNFLNEFLSGDIYHLNKYVFIILFVAFFKSKINKVEVSKKIIEIILIVLLINSFLIIAGFLFNINYFKSFPNTPRFGYTGLFFKSGESVLLYFLGSIYLYVQHLKGKSLLPVLYFLVIALFSGKKISFLFLFLFYIIHFCVRSQYKTYYRFLGLFLLISVLYFKNKILVFLIQYFPFWENIFEEKGFWTVVFSTRNLNFQRTSAFIQEYWSPINYLFGGTNYNILKVELDPVDLFVFFGVLGGSLYLYFLKKYFLNPITNITIKWLIVGYMLISMIYGAFLFNILLITFLYVFVIYYSTLDYNLSKTKDIK